MSHNVWQPVPATLGRSGARILGTTCVLLCAWVMLVAPAARGFSDQPFNLPPDSVVEKTYGPIPGQDPSSNNGPDVCSVSPSCVRIAFTVGRPQLGPTESFLVRLTLDWDTNGPSDVNPNTRNYLNLYVWNNPPGTGPIARSVGLPTKPKEVLLEAPSQGEYYITIANARGVNRGFRLRGESSRIAFTPPQESLDPSGSGDEGTPVPTDSAGTPTRTASGGQASPSVSPGTVGEGSVGSQPLPLPSANVPDPELFALGGGALENALAAPTRPREERRSTPPEPVSGLVVALGLAVLPGSAAAFVAGTQLLRRRGRTAGPALTA